ncbi:DNA repair protein RadA [Thermaurantiacus sp.]
MARASRRFVCQSCGSVSPRWLGQCPDCGAWNSFVPEAPAGIPRRRPAPGGQPAAFVPLAVPVALPERLATGIAEFDRALGGGLVPGSATLIGGDPGIGKSTLLLQAAGRMARAGRAVAYVSGEEAADQVRLRARRLGLGDVSLALAAATSVSDILAALGSRPRPDLLVIDSIQTMASDLVEGAPGTVGQVRAAAHELITYAKAAGAALLLVGHVTKDGQIAGPRVLEHMVDAVLYFEGDRALSYRVLRAVKNRFGGTDEIGVFTMATDGLVEVPNPSSLFLTARDRPVPGAIVFPALEGTRPLLVEIQALTVRLASGATPRRAVVGWDPGRLAMVLAVLEARAGLALGAHEVYLNVAGGLRIAEPAADLAVAAAIVSALADAPVEPGTVAFGEIALSGEIRPAPQPELRLKEAAKLGFAHALAPPGTKGALEIRPCAGVATLVDRLGARRALSRRGPEG